LAQKFLAFMEGPGFQDAIPENNWMFPTGKTTAPLAQTFDTLVKPDKTFLFSPEEVAENRRAWIDEWLNAMSKMTATARAALPAAGLPLAAILVAVIVGLRQWLRSASIKG